MKRWKLLITILIVGLVMALAIGLSADARSREQGVTNKVLPQGEEPLTAIGTTNAVTSTFSYQGLLSEGGEPVSGNREMVFGLYANDACTMSVGTPLTYTVVVSEGLFMVDLAFDQAYFNGQALWLQTAVEGTAIGCQPIQPVPYANSLRPGAIISASVASEESLIHARAGTYPADPSEGVLGAQIGLRTSLGYPVGLYGYAYDYGSVGVWGASDSEYGWGVNGVAWGRESIGVRGISNAITTTTYGVYGEAASPIGYGGYFENISTSDVGRGWALAATGRHGAVITATGGTGLYAYGSGDSAIGDDGVRGTHAGGDGVVGVSEGTGDLDNGVIGFSAGGYGVYGFSNGTGQYGGYFEDPIFVDGGCTGCTLRYIARNTSDSPLQLGDLVRSAGVDTSLEGTQQPVIQVAPAGEGDRVLGAVLGRTEVSIVEPGVDDAQPGAHYGPVGGAVGPGDYLVIVVQGMAQVQLDPAAEIHMGDPIAAGANGATRAAGASSFGVVLDEADGDGLAWVLVSFE